MDNVISNVSGELKTGDLIILSTGYSLDIGFYLGRGKTGTMQYYNLWALRSWLKKHKINPEHKPTKPWKSYINSPDAHRIVKYHTDCIESPVYLTFYNEAIEALKLLKLKS